LLSLEKAASCVASSFTINRSTASSSIGAVEWSTVSASVAFFGVSSSCAIDRSNAAVNATEDVDATEDATERSVASLAPFVDATEDATERSDASLAEAPVGATNWSFSSSVVAIDWSNAAVDA
jgi:hypothetical protein